MDLSDAADVACFQRCSAVRIHGRERYAQCLEACPGVRVDNYPCDGAEPPEQECVQVTRPKQRTVRRSPFAEGVGVGAIVGAAAVLAVAASGAEKAPPDRK